MLADVSCSRWVLSRKSLPAAGGREELPTNGEAEQLGAEAPVNGSRLPRGPVKRTLSG